MACFGNGPVDPLIRTEVIAATGRRGRNWGLVGRQQPAEKAWACTDPDMLNPAVDGHLELTHSVG